MKTALGNALGACHCIVDAFTEGVEDHFAGAAAAVWLRHVLNGGLQVAGQSQRADRYGKGPVILAQPRHVSVKAKPVLPPEPQAGINGFLRYAAG